MNEPRPHRRDAAQPARWRSVRAFVAATAITGLAAATAPVLQRLHHANLSLLFLTGVLVVAVRYGLWPSVYASILSFLIYNFFFTPPYLTLKVSEEGDVATLVFFLLIASLTGNLAARMRDATSKRERAIRELEQAKLVTEREQLRSALLSSVSHDLRTPLASIIGAASSLTTYEGSLSAADRSALLESIVEEAERLDRRIQNLLDMTRLGQGELRLQRDWEDVRDLLSAASRRLRLADHGVRLRTEIAPDAQIIRVNGDLLEQVFVNLLDNASQAAAPAAIRVSAGLDGDTVVMDFVDEGPGIPEAEREKVFEPFYRHRSGDGQSGAGLGLSICRGIVRAHGGEITAHDGPDGRGALLRIRLPHAAKRPPVPDDDGD